MEKAGLAPARVARRAPLASLLRYVSRVMPPPLPLLPPGSRWLRQRKDLLLLAVEDPPQCRTLRVSGGKKGENNYRSHRLAFPYLVYLLTFYRGGFEEMKMFFRVAPLTSPGDTLYHTCLPNVRGEPGHYGSQRVCLRYRPEMLEGVPLAVAVPALLDFFWSTGFNQDISNGAGRHPLPLAGGVLTPAAPCDPGPEVPSSPNRCPGASQGPSPPSKKFAFRSRLGDFLGSTQSWQGFER